VKLVGVKLGDSRKYKNNKSDFNERVSHTLEIFVKKNRNIRNSFRKWARHYPSTAVPQLGARGRSDWLRHCSMAGRTFFQESRINSSGIVRLFPSLP
jgi:hypothetical protein